MQKPKTKISFSLQKMEIEKRAKIERTKIRGKEILKKEERKTPEIKEKEDRKKILERVISFFSLLLQKRFHLKNHRCAPTKQYEN